MTKKHFIAYSALISIHLFIGAKDSAGTCSLKEEFNVCEYWHEGMTWDQFNEIKIPLAREGFINYVDKIESQKIAAEAGIEVPTTYLASREKIPVIDIISKLPNYVAKMTNLSWSDGLIIVKDGINMITGKPITPEEVQESLFKSFKTKPRDGQTWALFNCKPGFMIQEYIAERNEVKIQTIFGKVILGIWVKGETKKALAPFHGKFDRSGKKLGGNHEAPEWWQKAVTASEILAKGTDSLRVDFLIRKDGTLLMNELEYYPEMGSFYSASDQATLMNAVNEGYRNLAGKKINR